MGKNFWLSIFPKSLNLIHLESYTGKLDLPAAVGVPRETAVDKLFMEGRDPP